MIKQDNQKFDNYKYEYLPDIKRDSSCLHNSCNSCGGTGIRKDGSMCVHMISCPCPKCSFYC